MNRPFLNLPSRLSKNHKQKYFSKTCEGFFRRILRHLMKNILNDYSSALKTKVFVTKKLTLLLKCLESFPVYCTFYKNGQYKKYGNCPSSRQQRPIPKGCLPRSLTDLKVKNHSFSLKLNYFQTMFFI